MGVVPSPFAPDHVRLSGHPKGDPDMDRRLFGCHRNRVNRHVFATLAACVETHATTRGGEQRMISATADIHARIDACAALTHDDVTGEDSFAAEFFDAQTTAR